MLIWCAVMFCLGVLAFFDSMLNYGQLFRQVNTLVFMLLSLGVLARVYRKSRDRYWENYVMRKLGLESHVMDSSDNARVQSGVVDDKMSRKEKVGAGV